MLWSVSRCLTWSVFPESPLFGIRFETDQGERRCLKVEVALCLLALAVLVSAFVWLFGATLLWVFAAAFKVTTLALLVGGAFLYAMRAEEFGIPAFFGGVFCCGLLWIFGA